MNARTGAALLALLFPVLALGQEPTETPTAETPPPTPQGLAPVPMDMGGPVWNLGLRLREVWDSNPRFVDTLGPGSLISTLQGSLGHTRRFPRGAFTIAGDGSAVRYRDLEGLNQFSYSGQATASFRPSPRTNLNLDEAISSTHSGDALALTEAGLLLPLVVVRRTSSALTMTQRLSSKATASAVVRYDRVSFPSDELTGGSELSLGATYGRQLRPKQSVSLAYGFQDSSSTEGQPTHVHFLSGGWSGALRPRLFAGVSAGALTYAGTEGGRQWTPRLGATLSVRYPRTTLEGRYSRTASQAFGYGRERIADVAAISFSRSLGKAVQASTSYTYGTSRDPVDPSFRFDTSSYGADVRWILKRGLNATAGYAYRRRTPAAPSVPFSSGAFALGVAYGKDWR